MRHQITEYDLANWLHEDKWERFAGSFGAGSNKSLEADKLHGLYRVTDQGEVKYTGPNMAAAVRIYNDAP